MKDNEIETEELEQNMARELEQYRKEKEQIRQIVGQIGGIDDERQDRIVNVIFFILIFALFLFDILRHAFHIDVPLPPVVSIELGILLVSLKIIWMMHKQTKLEHFQFWILNSLEFRLNDIQQKLHIIEKKNKNDKSGAANNDQ